MSFGQKFKHFLAPLDEDDILEVEQDAEEEDEIPESEEETEEIA